MTALVRTRPTGWTIALACSAALIIGATAIYAAYPDPIDGIRRVIRVTAHTSLTFFLLAFTASSLQRLWPGPATQFLRRHRREFGVTFAVSHIIHAIAIIALIRSDQALFWQLSSIGNIIAGGSAYVVILLMLATSFPGPARWIGPRVWSVLHLYGAWFIWISFMVTNGKRIATGPGFAIAVGLLVLAASLKIAAKIQARRGATPY
ncbi:Protein-methionine-sulfoxide reductase heme-binding subunit MsrQ [Alphaproteobacteria bacterium SO-S41]|nr:Protein-methionine-sulfoxide reductase heme-binding subunit MsrQ [Alphaproteobacteria bacterium SO-S41]